MLSEKPLLDPKTCVVITYAGEREYIKDAIQSCLDQSIPVKIVVVIDGVTTDGKLEEQLVKGLLQSCVSDTTAIQIVISEISGPSALRNLGISRTECEFILPLDADDKIGENYVETAETTFFKNQNSGIVYGAARFFGLKNEIWALETFSKSSMAIENQIYSCAMFRKSDWLACGGYDEDLIYGAEDWDFWLKILSLNREVNFIEGETFFWYRQRINSRSDKFAKMTNEIDWTYNRIAQNNVGFMSEQVLSIYKRRVHLEGQIRLPKSILITLLKSILRKNKVLHLFITKLHKNLKK
jgi:glycosyltransferase involved in cell wall biosynthesis